jgi:pimeloyl-ACP methyl ester carboxylesterase
MSFTDTRLGPWHYGAAGTGEDGVAVILLHGLMLDHHMWSAQIAELSRFARVLAFDGPGHGLSAVPPPFGIDEHAAALGEALDALEVRSAIVVAHSWGGLVALHLALQRPEGIAALVLVDASADPETAPRRAKYEALAALVTAFGAPRWFVRLEPAHIVYGARALSDRPALVDDLHRTMNAGPRAGLVRAAHAVVRRRAFRRLGDIVAPTLVACGRDDDTWDLDCSVRLVRGLPMAELVVLDSGHTPPVEVPEAFNAAVIPFVRAQAAAASLARRRRQAAFIGEVGPRRSAEAAEATLGGSVSLR